MGSGRRSWAAGVAAMGTLLVGIAAVLALRHDPSPTGQMRSIAVTDSLGTPATSVFLVFPDGERLDPSINGVFYVPITRAGTEASLRDAATRREVCHFIVQRGSDDFIHIVLSNRNGTCQLVR